MGKMPSQSLKDQGKSRTILDELLEMLSELSQSLKDQGKSRTLLANDKEKTIEWSQSLKDQGKSRTIVYLPSGNTARGRNPLKIRASLGLPKGKCYKVCLQGSQSLKDQGKSRTTKQEEV